MKSRTAGRPCFTDRTLYQSQSLGLGSDANVRSTGPVFLRWSGTEWREERLRSATRIIDLSHEVHDGLVTYPGLPSPRVTAFQDHDDQPDLYAVGTTFHIGHIELVGNTGTYVDVPYHRFREGEDLALVSLDRLVDLEGVVVRHDPSKGNRIGIGDLSGLNVRDRAVLIHTGWSSRWGTEEYFADHFWLSEDAASWLVSEGATLVGIDSLNIDDRGNPRRPVHTSLLAAGIPIVEHLVGLDELPDRGFRLFVAPIRIRGMGSFPVRAFAIVGG